MKVLIVRNSEKAPEGDFGAWLARQGYAITVVAGADLQQAHLDDADLVVLLGSAHGVYETHIDWIARQRALVAARLAEQRPTIGICFGAQMMAAAAGGDSARMVDGTFFRGWMGIEHAAEPVFAGPWPRWHGDAITPPEGSTILAQDAGTIQAFALPRAIGVQFHPEATPEILQAWGEHFAQRGEIDVPALVSESEQRFAERAAAREALFATLVARATG